MKQERVCRERIDRIVLRIDERVSQTPSSVLASVRLGEVGLGCVCRRMDRIEHRSIVGCEARSQENKAEQALSGSV